MSETKWRIVIREPILVYKFVRMKLKMIEGIAVGLVQALVKKKQTKWSHVKFYKNKVEGTSLFVILKRKNWKLDFFVKKEKTNSMFSWTIEDLNCPAMSSWKSKT